MRTPSRACLALTLIMSVAAGAGAQGPRADEPVSAQSVARAIESIRAYLYEVQDPASGGWERHFKTGHTAGGETALVTLALLVSGESPQAPRLAKAVQYLRSRPMTGTYAVALRAHVWARMSDDYRGMLESDARWLRDACDAYSRFDYTSKYPRGGGRYDHSVTQYGLLGLWESSKRSGRVDMLFWEDAGKHFMTAQDRAGGWGYMPAQVAQPEGVTEATASMTTAGLTALLITQQLTHRDKTRAPPEMQRAIERGMAWLDLHIKEHGIPGGSAWTYYYLYGLERVGLLSGRSTLGGRDWFEDGAAFIMSELQPDGSVRGSTWESAMALLFLARGNYPVWISKLKLPGQRWNNHRSDLQYLTAYLSDVREEELNWQVVSLDGDPRGARGWLRAPVLFMSSDEAVEFTPGQVATIKRYLDLGGLLLASPDDGSEAFMQSARRLARLLYPDLSLKPLPADHPLFKVQNSIEPKQPVMGLSNGVRELMILAPRDWGFAFQSEKDPAGSFAYQVATNLYVWATDRGLSGSRLDDPFEQRKPAAGRGLRPVTIGRARYGAERHTTGPEPAAWVAIANHLANRAGLDVKVIDISLERIGAGIPGKDLPNLIHLAGADPAKISEPQRRAMRQYVQAGGTLLVETVGGRGGFARSVEEQLPDQFPGAALMIKEHPIVTGQGLTDGYDARRVQYRRLSVRLMGVEHRPRLAAFNDEAGRPAVIFSDEDLSLAALGVRQYGILGYDPESARRLLTNIVLWSIPGSPRPPMVQETPQESTPEVPPESPPKVSIP